MVRLLALPGSHPRWGCLLVACWLATCLGCGASVNETELRPKARQSLLSGVSALTGEEKFDVGDVWAAQQILKIYPDENLQSWVDAAAIEEKDHPLGLLVHPEARRALLPSKPDEGATRFMQYLYAPCGRPAARAARFVEDFASTEESGYVLAHQLLTIVWSEQTGVELPAETIARKEALWKRLLDEQYDDDEYSDLFVERAALLQAYGEPPHNEVLRWIDVIVKAQNPDGTWLDRRSAKSTYNGEEFETTPWRAHTTVLALWALADYFHRN